MSFSQEIAATREDAWRSYADGTGVVHCEECEREPKAYFMHGFDLASREAAGRILSILYQEEGVGRGGEAPNGIHPLTVQRIADEFGLESRGRHRDS